MDFQSSSDVSLDQMMGAFNHRIAELQQLMLTRGGNTSNYTADLTSLDTTVTALEEQLKNIKAHVKTAAEGVSQARALVELSSQQQKKLQEIFSRLPANLPGVDPGNVEVSYLSSYASSAHENSNGFAPQSTIGTPAIKDKKKAALPPKWYITADEFASLSGYMRGRLTIDKVNGAVDEMAGFAEANAIILRTKRRKVGEDFTD